MQYDSTTSRIAGGLDFRPQAGKPKAHQIFFRWGCKRAQCTRFENNPSIWRTATAIILVLIFPWIAAAFECELFPPDNIWNAPIDTMPVHPHSDDYIATIGANDYLHPDFGSGLWNGGPIGIPYVTVGGSQALVPVSFYYSDESDPGPYPIPPDAPIEGGSNSTGDRHVLVLDDDNCMLFELYDADPLQNGSWTAGSGAIYDLTSHQLRPQGWTSADAAGLPILPGLVRYEEILAGEITHAIRFTAPETKREYVWPARHFASPYTDDVYPPMGQRFRLKSNFDISGYSPNVQVILRAMKRYGIILADNGAAWFISGAPDERWDNDELRQLRSLTGAHFEAVDVSSLMIDPDSGQYQRPDQGPDYNADGDVDGMDIREYALRLQSGTTELPISEVASKFGQTDGPAI